MIRKTSEEECPLDVTQNTTVSSAGARCTPPCLTSCFPSKGGMVTKTQQESIHLVWAESKKKKLDVRWEESDRPYRNLSVSFADVEVRSYPIILGDNPAVSAGPPLTIDWDPSDLVACSVDEYEKDREGIIRGIIELKIPSDIRFQMLTKTVKTAEIAKRTKEMTDLKRQRLETTSMLYRASKEEKVEKFVRGFRNLVTNKKKKEKQYMQEAMPVPKTC